MSEVTEIRASNVWRSRQDFFPFVLIQYMANVCERLTVTLMWAFPKHQLCPMSVALRSSFVGIQEPMRTCFAKVGVEELE